jgi:lipopolysaccharide/colanic/teichoic acid biosynthesis glycosyltransferase
MTHTFKDSGNARPGEILAFICESFERGAEAAVAAGSLPVLTRHAGCKPLRRGPHAGGFVFRAPADARAGCGAFERLLASLLLLALSPALAAVAALIFVFDGAPVLFRQERYGCDGAPFTLLKFRTMKRRSEQLHEKLQRKRGTEGRLFKLDRDPRVTRIGAFLRRTFLDELPQLVNVARGEMRLIGPRPLPASDQAHYRQPGHALRLKGMPGMTGLWQIAGRNERTFDEMCLLDTYYLCNRSRALDLRIAGRTLGLIVRQARLKREAERGGQQPVAVEHARGGGE